MPVVLISTLGTSLLTNVSRQVQNNSLEQEETGKNLPSYEELRDTANLKEGEIITETKNKLKSLQEIVNQRLKKSNPKQLRALSAELNGIYAYYNQVFDKSARRRDVHWLIATDTYQGQLVAETVEGHLRDIGFSNIISYTPEGLDTSNTASFTHGIREIVSWCEECLLPYKEKGFYVIFNLVGGFKSLQGYLNTLGMFYADEILYIFESRGAELLRIPRLPIKLDELPVLQEKAELLARIVNGYLARGDEVKGIPELMLETDGEVFILSPWGLLLWERNKNNILGNSNLFSFPHIVVKESFAKDYKRVTDVKRKAKIQDKLAKVSVIYGEKGLEGLREDQGLKYETYRGQKGGEQVDHFYLDKSWRITCVVKDGALHLRRVGPHDLNEQETR